MPHREYDIQTDLLTLCLKRRQLQLICRACAYRRTWRGVELAQLTRTVGNCKVCEFQNKARCSQCGAGRPKAAIDFADATTRRLAAHRVGSLGQVLARGGYLAVHCERLHCGHSTRPDLAALVARLGQDYPLQRYLERCRCTKCQARWPEIGLQVPPMWGRQES
jgi:hypothetical protein